MAQFRGKFYVLSVVPQPEDIGGSTVSLHTKYDADTPEDQRFAGATPSGRIDMLVTNPAVLEIAKPGKVFFVDFTEVAV
jgi:hypothetical protein